MALEAQAKRLADRTAAVALAARERAVDREDEKNLTHLALSLHIAFSIHQGEPRVLCDEKDVTEAIRSPGISLLASDISKRQGVRKALVQKQRELGEGGGVVLEGRDIGTVVFPDADVKFFLSASAEERGKRRFLELSAKNEEITLQQTIAQVVQRDAQDEQREHAPLRKADDAVEIDTTSLSIGEVLTSMEGIVRERMA
ncbi:MAG: (d)CMP kinase [Azonexaceae bacterium]|nr:(d)CMP kinase [Azonexaceae bacterium]